MPFSEANRLKFQARAEQLMVFDPIEADPAYIEAYDQEVADMMLRHGCSEVEVLSILGYLPILPNGHTTSSSSY